ncbi:MAG: hypothetical protein EA419_03230 [Wenzhouxiangella sp.]|nr:MAG: hypothetical protein EA419_03230 [Wenzhouxiangella sp.]
MNSFTTTLKSLLITVLLATWSNSSTAADNLLDPSFGTDGIASLSVGARASNGRKIVVQGDGKIVQVGDSRDGPFGSPSVVTLVRFNADGTLDTDFGDQGVARTNFGADSSDRGFAVGLQDDGQIVAAGAAFFGPRLDAGLVRYDATGELDASFGDEGKVVINLGGNQYITDLAFQSDGKIIAVGRTMDEDFLVMRFTTAGQLDTDFGSNGIVTGSFDANAEQEAFSVAVLDDDSMIVAGGGIRPGFGDGSTTSLLKLTADGSLDTSFNGTGKVAITIEGQSWARSVVVDSDGRFLVGGFSGPDYFGDVAFLVLRFAADGSLDPAFGDNGQVITEFPEPYSRSISIYTVALQDDGRIVAAGAGQNVPDNQNDLLLVRYQEDGSLDTSLDGADGRVAITLDSNITVSSVTTQSIEGKERILVGGGLVGATTSFAVFRFTEPAVIFRDRFEQAAD